MIKSATLTLLFLASAFAMQGQIDSTKSAQDKKLGKAVFKDPKDGKLDMSDFLINYHGFIPVPSIVTEPALGGFGGMLTPVFITPNKYSTPEKYVAPNITAVFGMYTANKSWGFGALRSASLPQYKLKYKIGAAYGDVNLDLYRVLPLIGEAKFSFNFKMAGAFGSILREIGNSDFYLGLSYLYLNNQVSLNNSNDSLPDFVADKDIESKMSSIGFLTQFDKRDNVFTPNTGWYFASNFSVNASWTGSDYDFQFLNVLLLKYFQFTPKWVSGFRAESSAIFGDAPFYLRPGINLRGVPMARYQGEQSYIVETEQRFDFTPRWSILAFGGMAKAPTETVSFSNSELIYNYGTGFRYLIARKFGMRMGVDFAWSNDNFGWYIILGSAWNNRN